MQHEVLKKFLLLTFLWSSFNASAQQDSMAVSNKNTKPAFQLIAAGSFLAGASSRDFQLQVVPGLRYKTWSVGGGASVDYYFQRTVPLFLDVRKVFQNPMPLFIYADAGWNLPWIKKDKNIVWYKSDFTNGLYYDFGAGWQVKTGKRHAFLFSAGYSAKKLTEVQTAIMIPSGADEKYYTTTFRYDLRRISIKVGFQL